jgi:hypothetical protein
MKLIASEAGASADSVARTASALDFQKDVVRLRSRLIIDPLVNRAAHQPPCDLNEAIPMPISKAYVSAV